jgi:phospholipid/cholesterol/gamma-HCH transport system substrate-binding protein
MGNVLSTPIRHRTRPRPPAPAPRGPSPVRSRWRAPAVALLVVVAATTAFVVTRGASHHYRVVLQNAGQLVKGDLVRVGGTKAGRVDGIDLTDDGQAAVRISVSDGFAPLRDGTTAIVRAESLTGVASRYVDLSPAPTFKPELPDGATIATDKTTSIVEVDQLFDTLDPQTRTGLRRLIKGQADWYHGRERQANLSAQYFPPALEATTSLFGEIDRDSATLQQLLVQTGTAFGALTKNRAQLTDLVSHTHRTMHALSSDNRSLSAGLRELPGALRQGSDTFAALRPALGDLQHLVDVTGPATRNLAPFLGRLHPLLDEAVPTFAQLRAMFARPGPHNDLYDALLDLPPLAQLAHTTFPHAEQALRQSTPVFGFARPYVPDLVSWVGGFGAAMAPYDANGHYAKTAPVFDAFGFTDDSQGGHLTPKAPGDRGKGANLQTGKLRRCPGTAGTSPDGSAPFVDNGPLANPDCNPSQIIGGTP